MNKCLLTVVGEVGLSRRYYRCKKCKAVYQPLDDWAGLVDGMSTPAARRMLSLAGMSWSFDTASDRLVELCLLKVSNDTIRRVSEQEGRAVQKWMQKSSKPGEVFRQAKGDNEFLHRRCNGQHHKKGGADLRLERDGQT